MSRITNKQLQQKVRVDTWLSETLIWGHGCLVARISRKGERHFYFRYTNSDNKRVRLPLGPFDAVGKHGMLTLAEARQKAYELAQLHSGGIQDIREHLELLLTEESEVENEGISNLKTVDALFEHWTRIDLVNRKDKGAEVSRIYKKDIQPHIGKKDVDDVTKKHITYITDQILLRGSDRMANVVFSLLRQMFLFGLDRDWVEVDPTANIRKSKIGSKGNIRDRVLADSELSELNEKLTHSDLLVTSKLALLICLSTCCRIGEITQSAWKSVNFEERIWTILDTKNGHPLEVHLSDFSLDLFKKLETYTGWSEWCIPNRHNTDPINSKSVSKQVGDRQLAEGKQPISGRTKHVDALKLSDGRWTPHDLRRTGATIMVASGVLPEVADKCLNHVEQNKIKRTYLRHDYQQEMKDAWDILGRKLSPYFSLKSFQGN